MKKGLRFALMCFTLLVGGVATTCACVSTNRQASMCLRAEAEQEFEEKTYTLESEEEKVVITITSENECVVTKTVGEEVETHDCNYVVIYENIICISGFSEEAFYVALNEDGTFLYFTEDTDLGELVDTLVNKITNKITVFKDTILIPLVSGVSITSIVATIANLIINYVKNKKVNKKVDEANTTLDKANLIFATIAKMYDSIDQSKEINAETKQLLTDAVNQIKSSLDIVEKETKTVEKTLPILKLLVTVTCDVAKTSPDCVKSGIIDQIEEVKKLTNQL